MSDCYGIQQTEADCGLEPPDACYKIENADIETGNDSMLPNCGRFKFKKKRIGSMILENSYFDQTETSSMEQRHVSQVDRTESGKRLSITETLLELFMSVTKNEESGSEDLELRNIKEDDQARINREQGPQVDSNHADGIDLLDISLIPLEPSSLLSSHSVDISDVIEGELSKEAIFPENKFRHSLYPSQAKVDMDDSSNVDLQSECSSSPESWFSFRHIFDLEKLDGSIHSDGLVEEPRSQHSPRNNVSTYLSRAWQRRNEWKSYLNIYPRKSSHIYKLRSQLNIPERTYIPDEIETESTTERQRLESMIFEPSHHREGFADLSLIAFENSDITNSTAFTSFPELSMDTGTQSQRDISLFKRQIDLLFSTPNIHSPSVLSPSSIANEAKIESDKIITSKFSSRRSRGRLYKKSGDSERILSNNCEHDESKSGKKEGLVKMKSCFSKGSIRRLGSNRHVSFTNFSPISPSDDTSCVMAEISPTTSLQYPDNHLGDSCEDCKYILPNAPSPKDTGVEKAISSPTLGDKSDPIHEEHDSNFTLRQICRKMFHRNSHPKSIASQPLSIGVDGTIIMEFQEPDSPTNTKDGLESDYTHKWKGRSIESISSFFQLFQPGRAF